MSETWTNPDGLVVNFNRTLAEQSPTGVTAESTVKTYKAEFDSQNPRGLDTAGDTTGRDAFLPSGALILSSHFIVNEAFTSAGATTLTIGLAQADGTVIDADGIDAAIAKTAIDNAVKAVDNDGALVGGNRIGANDGFVYFTTATGPWTAGRGTLVVRYLEVE